MTAHNALRAGTTMIETMIVLIIVGVLLGLGLPRIDVYKYRADANAVVIASPDLIDRLPLAEQCRIHIKRKSFLEIAANARALFITDREVVRCVAIPCV